MKKYLIFGIFAVIIISLVNCGTMVVVSSDPQKTVVTSQYGNVVIVPGDRHSPYYVPGYCNPYNRPYNPYYYNPYTPPYGSYGRQWIPGQYHYVCETSPYDGYNRCYWRWIPGHFR